MSAKRQDNFVRDVVYRIPTSEHKPPKYMRVVMGGLGGMLATVVVHPLDLIKVRIQVYKQSISTMTLASKIIRCQGFKTLYVGLSAALMRQATNTTARLGTYFWLYDEYHSKYDVHPRLSDKVMIGIYAGMAGAFAGNPAELALVRMMAATNPPTKDIAMCTGIRLGLNKRYRHVFHAINTVIQNEGVSALWRGGMLTLTRSILVSVVQINTYTKTHERLNEQNWFRKDLTVHLYSALVSSFLTGIMSLPIDLVKTIYQVNKDGLTQPEIIDDIIKTKGVKYFWKGFLPYFVRMTIHTALAYIVVDKLLKLYYVYHDDLPSQK